MRCSRVGPVSRVRAHPALHLVQTVDGDAQHLAAVVLDDQRLDRLTPDDDALQPPEPPDPVLHVHDVVAGRQLGEALQRGRAAKPTDAAEPAVAPEDLVIRQDVGGRLGILHAEPARERTHDQVAAGRGPAATIGNEVVEALRLAVVVAEDAGLGAPPGRSGQERAEPVHPALEGGGTAGVEDRLADVFLHEGDARVTGHTLRERFRRQEESVRAGGGVVVPERFPVAGLGSAPQTSRPFLPRFASDTDQDRVQGEAVEDGAAGTLRLLHAAPRSAQAGCRLVPRSRWSAGRGCRRDGRTRLRPPGTRPARVLRRRRKRGRSAPRAPRSVRLPPPSRHARNRVPRGRRSGRRAEVPDR